MSRPALTSLAIRVHRLKEMVSFYEGAFGAELREVDAGGLTCWFGSVAGLTLKLVPLRDDANFDGYPNHQPDFEVESVEAVIAVAEKHGGCREGEIIRAEGQVHGAVRDPDGNTVELYARG